MRRRGSRLHRRLRAALPAGVVLVGGAVGTLAAFCPADVAVAVAQGVAVVLAHLWVLWVLAQP